MGNPGGGKKRDLSALLGTSKSSGGGKSSSASRVSGKPASSILEQARAAAERAKRAKTTDAGVDDASGDAAGARAPTARAPREPPVAMGRAPSRWDAPDDQPATAPPPAARPKSRWDDDADEDDERDAEDAARSTAAAAAAASAPESYMDKMVREAMEFKLANLEREAVGASEPAEVPATTRGGTVDVAKIMAMRTPSTDGDATPRAIEPGADAADATPTVVDPAEVDASREPAAAAPGPMDDLDDLGDGDDVPGDGDGDGNDALIPVPGDTIPVPIPGDGFARRERSPAAASPERAELSEPSSDEEDASPGARSFDMMAGCRSVFEFEQLNRIDEGTYGVVFRARDKKTGKVRALKKVKMEKEREGFPMTALREANILLSMHHPNVVDVSEMVVGNSLDSVYMVMEFAEHDLKGLMETMTTPFSTPEVKCLTRQLLSGVAYLHDNWVLHRDLKTSNVLVNNRGQLKICDFGLARHYGDPLRAYTHVVVTLWYRAPELLLGQREYGTPVDCWSLGCIMAELLGRDPLFQGKSEIDQIDRVFRLLGTPNEKIWPGFEDLPGVRKVKFAHQPYNKLRQRFPKASPSGAPTVSDLGFDLLNRLLAYDPKRRISAEEGLRHEWFEEFPPPKDQRLMPTYPSKAAGAGRAVAAARRAD